MSQPIVIDYTPPPTLDKFMCSDQRVRAVRGPVGSGKSSAMVMELFRRGIEQSPDQDGIRRTRAAIVRNTLKQLETTCLPTIKTMLGPLAVYRPSKHTVYIEFDDVYMEWLLLPLDTPENVQRLLSLEITMAWISEFREINPQIVKDTYSRCGRYPSKIQGGCTWYGLFMETNSFSEDSPWYKELEEERPEAWGYFVQPPGLPAGENIENLSETYYADQVENNGGDDSYWVRQYIYNEIAPSIAGEAVFRNTFIHSFHTSEKGLLPIPQSPLCIGLDTGRNPSAVITQIDPRGRFLVLGESYAENMGMERFVNESLLPLLATERYRGIPVYLVVDPAGVSRGEIGEESVIDALKRLGFATVPALTNKLDPRLRAVDKWLGQQIGGEAAFRIDHRHCPTLLLALQARYRYKKRSDGSLEPKPEKNHPWSDLADALQYAALGGSTSVRARATRLLSPQPTHADLDFMPVGAWT